MAPRVPTGPRFAPRDPPSDDLAQYVARGLGSAMWQHRARIRLHAPAAAVAARITPSMGTVTLIDDATCEYVTGADTLPVLAVYLGFLGVDFDVLDPPELREHVRALGERYRRAGQGA